MQDSSGTNRSAARETEVFQGIEVDQRRMRRLDAAGPPRWIDGVEVPGRVTSDGHSQSRSGEEIQWRDPRMRETWRGLTRESNP